MPEEHAGSTGAEAAQKKELAGPRGLGRGEATTTASRSRCPGVSDREVLMDQDFSTFPAEQLDEVPGSRADRQAARARRMSRRKRRPGGGGVIDLRRSMRANLMKGEIIELRRRERRRRKVRLVLLCDVSGSMDLYSRFLLQFLYALQNVFGRVETFTFSTRLTRVTEHSRARPTAGAAPAHRGAGLVRRDAHRRIARRSSTAAGAAWWTGAPSCSCSPTAGTPASPRCWPTRCWRIKRARAGVIWLNPLLGNPSYEPLTRGMAAALPLVDHFAAAHNLASLRDLAGHLNLR